MTTSQTICVGNDGVTYKAVDASNPGTCAGCALAMHRDCVEVILEFCAGEYRTDGRDIIWLAQDQDTANKGS